MDVLRVRPKSIRGPADWFTGEVWIDLIVRADEPSRLRALSVHFLPGSRTAWHSHPVGQVLVVTEGTGRTQSRGGDVEEIRQGDVVSAAPGEWHWHGAAPDSFMTHLALQEAGSDGSDVEWGVHVTDDEYVSSP